MTLLITHCFKEKSIHDEVSYALKRVDCHFIHFLAIPLDTDKDIRMGHEKFSYIAGGPQKRFVSFRLGHEILWESFDFPSSPP